MYELDIIDRQSVHHYQTCVSGPSFCLFLGYKMLIFQFSDYRSDVRL